MEIGICSWTFHRALAEGKHDIFKFIEDSKALGATQIDPWNGHLQVIRKHDDDIKVPVDFDEHSKLKPVEKDYLKRVAEKAEEVGLPWGLLAADGGHIWDDKPEWRERFRCIRHRWMECAEILGCNQIRIDVGGEHGGTITDEMKPVIVESYGEMIERGKANGIEVLVENHWGVTNHPDAIEWLMQNVEGLGFLHDTNNWREPFGEAGRARCSKYASAAHIKTFDWAEDPKQERPDIAGAVQHFLDAGYKGPWGIESVPKQEDEFEACGKAIALVRELVEGK